MTERQPAETPQALLKDVVRGIQELGGNVHFFGATSPEEIDNLSTEEAARVLKNLGLVSTLEEIVTKSIK